MFFFSLFFFIFKWQNTTSKLQKFQIVLNWNLWTQRGKTGLNGKEQQTPQCPKAANESLQPPALLAASPAHPPHSSAHTWRSHFELSWVLLLATTFTLLYNMLVWFVLDLSVFDGINSLLWYITILNQSILLWLCDFPGKNRGGGSSQPRDRTRVSCIGGGVFTTEPSGRLHPSGLPSRYSKEPLLPQGLFSLNHLSSCSGLICCSSVFWKLLFTLFLGYIHFSVS